MNFQSAGGFLAHKVGSDHKVIKALLPYGFEEDELLQLNITLLFLDLCFGFLVLESLETFFNLLGSIGKAVVSR